MASQVTDICIHELIERQADRTPDALALTYGDRRLSYRDLNASANRLARLLQGLGIGPEVVVALRLEPSLHAVVALVGVLKAGGAFLVLHPDDPPSRMTEMVTEAGAAITLTTTALASTPDRAGGMALNLDRLEARLAAERSDNVCSGVDVDGAAFVRFTSGSTGKPKGVVNIHRSFVSRLGSLPLPDIQANDVCAVNTSTAFGSRCLFPLALGARIAILQDRDVKDVARFASCVKQQQITSVYLVPTMLRQLLQLEPAEVDQLKGLRVITVGGEALAPELVTAFRRALPEVMLLSAYGSNEIGTTAALQRLNPGGDLPARPMIGRPVVDTKIYLLDRDMKPVGAGEIGEICVASRQIARGYLNRSASTAERFLPDPFDGASGQRLLRTGDLGRYAPEIDAIEFCGRIDHQVKIRGFRVELEEVEATLNHHPLVREAVACVRTVDGDNRLVAYVRCANGSAALARELRLHVKQHLADYMVPSSVMFVDDIPHTKEGKVDRRRLPAFVGQHAGLDMPVMDVRDPVAAAVGDIWASVLQIGGAVGDDQDFSDLGGDSIGAVRVAIAVSKEFGVRVPVEELFERPTVSGAATVIASYLRHATARVEVGG
jgi:amino acid adenylation domain-containing protein